MQFNQTVARKDGALGEQLSHMPLKQVNAVGGENVIISDRNAKCMEVMNREIAKGEKNIGIFYGAVHFPEMEKALLEKGFTRVKTQWLTAWEVAQE